MLDSNHMEAIQKDDDDNNNRTDFNPTHIPVHRYSNAYSGYNVLIILANQKTLSYIQL